MSNPKPKRSSSYGGAQSYGGRMIRKRDRDTLINESNFEEVDRSPLVKSWLSFIETRNKVFEDSVSELLQFDKLEDPIITTQALEGYICGDPKLAARVDFAVITHFINFLEKHNRGEQVFASWELEELQFSVLRILLRVLYYQCCKLPEGTVLIPILLDLMSDLSPYNRLAVATLTTIAHASPRHLENFVDKALGIVENIVKNNGATRICPVIKFMVALCRHGHVYRLDKNDAALNILQSILQMNYTATEQPIVQACYALQYLTCNGKLKLEGEAFNKLIKSLVSIIGKRHGTGVPSFPAYALGVVGNIARWATSEQAKIMASNFMLLESLQLVILLCTSKEIQKEACQIIANIAARGTLSIEAMHSAKLIVPLCGLLEKDGSDVKTEAACALYNGIYGSLENAGECYLENDIFPVDESI